MQELGYMAPTLEVLSLEVEQGFTLSGDWDKSVEDPVTWGDDFDEFA